MNRNSVLLIGVVLLLVAACLVAMRVMRRRRTAAGEASEPELQNRFLKDLSASKLDDVRKTLWSLYHEIDNQQSMSFGHYQSWVERLTMTLEGGVLEPYTRDITQLCRNFTSGTPRDMAATVHRIRGRLYRVINSLQSDHMKRDCTQLPMN